MNMTDEEIIAYWRGAYDRMAARSIEDGARIAALEAQNKFLRDALEMISRVAGNLPDDILCSATGANDARYRGGLVCTARDIARAALEAKP